jgi:hypothetical protein
MEKDEKRLHALQQLYGTLAKRGIFVQCAKCNGGPGVAPCAYPNLEYRDCPMKEARIFYEIRAGFRDESGALRLR